MKYEYTITNAFPAKLLSIEEDLNELGNYGWELVSVLKKGDDYYEFFLKRPKKS